MHVLVLQYAITPYYFNPKIHNFGNVGMGGYVHSRLAPYARRVIDISRYNGENIRETILKPYENMTQLDMCCGIGDSTMKHSIGIDTSNHMINMAKNLYNDKYFYIGNAEYIKFNEKFDIVTCMFALHEIPYYARRNIIRNAISQALHKVIVLDISSNYKPSRIMLSGEPYLLNYLANIDKQMNKYKFEKINYIENHVDIWTLTI